ncbi:MAG: hypothetical protein AAFZ87_14540, partial [Planctomycetota bacterium]
AVGVRPAAEKLDAHLGAAIALTAARDASATGDGEDDTPIAATGTVRVSDLWTAADGARAAEIAAIEVDVERFAPEAIELSRVALVGGAARAARLEDGVLRVLGLDFVGAPGAPADVQPPEDQDENTLEDAVADAEPEQGSETETAEPESDAPSPGRALRIAAVEVAPFALTFEDAAAPGGAPIEHAVTVGLDASDVVLGAATDEPLRAGVTVAAEGAASLRADLTARLPVGPADPLEADLRLRSDELTLASVRPYLEAAGVTPTFEAGALAVDARVARAGGTDGPVDLEVGPVRLADGGTTLLAVERLAVDDLVQSADGLRIAEVALDGIVAPATLFEGGGFRGFGVASIGGPGAGVDGAESGVPVGLEGGTLRLNDVAFGGAGGTTRITGTLDPVGVRIESASRDSCGPARARSTWRQSSNSPPTASTWRRSRRSSPASNPPCARARSACSCAPRRPLRLRATGTRSRARRASTRSSRASLSRTTRAHRSLSSTGSTSRSTSSAPSARSPAASRSRACVPLSCATPTARCARRGCASVRPSRLPQLRTPPPPKRPPRRP